MQASFAALESRVTGAVFRHMTNQVATFTTGVGAPISVESVFDTPPQSILGAGLMESQQPQLLVPTSAVPSVTHGAPVTVASVNYVVAGIEPDGTGVTRLILERAP